MLNPILDIVHRLTSLNISEKHMWAVNKLTTEERKAYVELIDIIAKHGGDKFLEGVTAYIGFSRRTPDMNDALLIELARTEKYAVSHTDPVEDENTPLRQIRGGRGSNTAHLTNPEETDWTAHLIKAGKRTEPDEWLVEKIRVSTEAVIHAKTGMSLGWLSRVKKELGLSAQRKKGAS